MVSLTSRTLNGFRLYIFNLKISATNNSINLQPQQGMVGFGGLAGAAETKYSTQQGLQQQTSQTPPSSGYGGGLNDFVNRYKLEQTIRQLHSFSTTDPRTSFGAPFSGV